MFGRFIVSAAIAGLLSAQPGPLDAAWDQLAKGNRPAAVRILEKILSANPRDGEAHLLLGSILTEAGRISEAVSQLREAVRLMPQSADAHNAVGEALNGAGNLSAARASFETAVRVNPQFAQAHVNLGLVLVQQSDAAAAARHLDRALRILGPVPDSAYPRYLRAKIYTEQDQPEKAASLLKEAIALQADFAEAWSDLGQARKALLDDAGAFAAFQRSVDLSPENAISQYRLGAEYLRRGKAHDAVPHLKAAVRLAPKNQSALYSLQMALRQDGQVDQARQVKEKLAEVLRNVDIESQNAFQALGFNNEGAALEKSGDIAGALEKYRRAVALDAGHVGYRLNLAVASLRLGRWTEGIAELRECLRREPANMQAEAALRDALEQAPVQFGGKGMKAGVRGRPE